VLLLPGSDEADARAVADADVERELAMLQAQHGSPAAARSLASCWASAS
jgi:hypothetical protein